MNLNLAFGLALLITCALAFCICAFSRWHQKRYLRVPNRVLNEHRVTLKFAVGNDVKAFGEDTQ